MRQNPCQTSPERRFWRSARLTEVIAACAPLDPNNCDFAFFANSRVMALEAAGLHGALAADQVFAIRLRKTYL